jgi:hypothetical protein
MTEKKPIPRAPTYDDALIADLAEAVYRIELGLKDAASMVEKDKDDGTKLRRRAQAYASVVRATLDALHAMQEDRL